MPSLKMKTTLRRGSLGGENGLHVCQNSNVISKKSLSCVKVSQQTTELDVHGQILEDACSITEVSTCKTGVDEAIEYLEVVDGEKCQFQMQPPSLVDLTIMGRMDFVPASSPNLETIFSRVLKSVELHSENNVHGEADDKTDADLPQLRSDDSDDKRRSSCDYRICDVSDFLISDMIVADLPFDYDPMYDEIIDTGTFPNYKFGEQGVLFDVAEQYMMLPVCEDTAGTSNIYGAKLSEEKIMDSDDSNLYLAIDQLRSDNDDCDVDVSNMDQAEGLDSQFLSKDDVPNLPNALWSMVLHKEACRKPITLVLDLDETLVHSTLDHSDDADFTFRVFFNMKEQTVYVKQRPFLRTFLEKVAEMFNITVFTASQSIYASQLLDKLDPDGKLISHRAYRESCIFSDGNYTKDLTVLGVDLAKVAIIDNSPQVFRLQVNNGIPIKSWFDDPSDSELDSLLPFLETLAAADDVRPIIAKKFNNVEQ